MPYIRALWAVGATLLAFASEGLQGVMTSMVGSSGVQLGMVGTALLGYLFIEVFAPGVKPTTKRRPRAPKPVATQKKRAPRPKRP